MMENIVSHHWEELIVEQKDAYRVSLLVYIATCEDLHTPPCTINETNRLLVKVC